jgi:hypothetical protein
LLRNRAMQAVLNWIKHLAILRPGFPQSYPHTKWKQQKSPPNQSLGPER